MQQYKNFLKHILDNGVYKQDRTGTGTISTFGYQMRFDLQKGFPATTVKKLAFKTMLKELLWFLDGDTNANTLIAQDCHIWDAWMKPDGDLGPVYGKQWVNWEGKDGKFYNQIQAVVDMLKTDPNSRRIIVSAWNVGELDQMALMPCHAFFQFYVANGKLSCQLYQRSADAFLGVPFNIASYSALTHMLAQQCNLDVGEFIWTAGDCHIYSNHVEQVNLCLQREPLALPKLVLLRKPDSIFDYRLDDFELLGYNSHSAIKAEVAV
jgi:thymidylate synthase